MKTMSWAEIEQDWGGLQKRHRMDIAQAVARYCVGHKLEEVAKLLGQSKEWVTARLDMAGVCAAVGHEAGPPASWVGKHRGLQEDCGQIVNEYAPSVDVKYAGRDKSSIAAVEGDDAEAFQTFLDYYIQEGHTPAVAVRLAKADWAGEEAVEAGVIKESHNKRNEKVNQILFPDEPKERWELDFRGHMARVGMAAKFLDESRINCLRRKSTCERVASTHEKWLEQIERLLNLNPTLNKD